MYKKSRKTADILDPPSSGRGLLLIGVLAALAFVTWHFMHRPSEARFAAHQQEALDDMQAAVKVCEDKYLYKEIDTYKQMAECATPGIIDAFSSAGFPYMDLITVFTAERVKLAEQIDRKLITKDEARAKESEFLAKLQDKALARHEADKR